MVVQVEVFAAAPECRGRRCRRWLVVVGLRLGSLPDPDLGAMNIGENNSQ